MAGRTTKSNTPKVVEDCHDLLLWLIPHLDKFPRNRRFTPPLDRRFIYDSYACRRGKGVHAAVDRYQHYARRYDYILKLDIPFTFENAPFRVRGFW